jgi:hypothetical protein
MTELSKNEEKIIISNNIKRINGDIYNAIINKRVCDRIEDKQQSEQLIETLKKLEKAKDEFELMLKEIQE